MEKGEARLVSLACSNAPEGYGRWTLHLLADRLVELNIVDPISHECGCQVMNINTIKPWQKRMWCMPAQDNAAFVCQMEAVAEVYKRPRNPCYPVVCMDETSVQCVREVRPPIAARPGERSATMWNINVMAWRISCCFMRPLRIGAGYTGSGHPCCL